MVTGATVMEPRAMLSASARLCGVASPSPSRSGAGAARAGRSVGAELGFRRRCCKVVTFAGGLPPPGQGQGSGTEDDDETVKSTLKDNFDVLSSNLKKSLEYEKNRLVGDMDSLIETSDIKINKDIKSVSEEENALLNFWSGTGISVAGGVAVVGLLILFIFVIGPPPQKV